MIMIDILIGVTIGMLMCGVGASIYAFILMKDSPAHRIKKFLKKYRLIPKRKIQVQKWEDDKYLVEVGAEAIASEYLRQKYKITTGEDITLEFFVRVCADYIIHIEEEDNEGFFIVRGGSDLLRPPDPPKEFPPIPEGWNVI